MSDEGCRDNPFAGEELLTLEGLINQVQDPTNEGSVAVDEYIDDESVSYFQPLIDVRNVEWTTDVRNELLKVPDESDDDAATLQQDERKPKFQSVREVSISSR